MRKKAVSILIVSAMLISASVMSGCSLFTLPGDSGSESGSSNSAGTQVFRVGFANLDNSDPNTYPAMLLFQEYVESDAFAEAVGTPVEVLTADSASDVETQSTNVETFLTRGVDMVFIVGVDTEANTTVVEMCNAENVPVFMVGTEASGGEWKFAGFDETDFGAVQGQWCAENLPENSKICLLTCMPGREVTTKRQDGFESAVAQREDLEIISVQTGESSAETAMQVTEDWITAYGTEMDCIVAMDNIMAQGVVEALAQNGLSDEVTVVSYVGSEEDAQLIKDGTIDAAVFCYWPSIGTLCGEIAQSVYVGEDVPERSNIELYEMDATNVDQLIADVIGE